MQTVCVLSEHIIYGWVHTNDDASQDNQKNNNIIFPAHVACGGDFFSVKGLMCDDCLTGQNTHVQTTLHLNRLHSNRGRTVILDFEIDLLVQHNDSVAHSAVISARVGHLQLRNVHLEGSASSDGLQTVSPHSYDRCRRPGTLNDGLFSGADPFAEEHV